jgi:hypothetical protein
LDKGEEEQFFRISSQKENALGVHVCRLSGISIDVTDGVLSERD